MQQQSELIRAAEFVANSASNLGVPLLVIGAAALAGHRYVRTTEDIDLAGNVPLQVLQELGSQLGRLDYEIDLREPDADDPLGGVLDIQGRFGQIQVISFADRFPAVIEDALKDSPIPIKKDSSLQIIPLPHLIVLKLYAGGLKSKADVVEVLLRNPEADLIMIEALCHSYRIKGFSEILHELECRRPE